MRRFVLFSLALALTGCGLAQPEATPRAAAGLLAQSKSLNGAYLAVSFRPSGAFERQAEQLRRQLGFVDMSHAVPPRSGQELHVTVGYFKHLSADELQRLRRQFDGKKAQLTVTGYGVANKQVAYFSVEGIEADRRFLQGEGLRYDATDAHITFGVSPKTPRDVHGVAKKAQKPIEPVTIEGEYHLKQGQRVIW